MWTFIASLEIWTRFDDDVFRAATCNSTHGEFGTHIIGYVRMKENENEWKSKRSILWKLQRKENRNENLFFLKKKET